MEAVGFQPTSIGGNYHDGYTDAASGKTFHTDNGKDFDAGNNAFTSEYHVFAVEWDAQRIDYYVDGIRYYSVLDGQVGPLYDELSLNLGDGRGQAAAA